MSNNVNVVFILDRSGSMTGLEDDVIGGFNGYIDTLRRENNGDAKFSITVVRFDDVAEKIWDRVPLSSMRKLTKDDYFVRGSTALLDAVGQTVSEIRDDGGHCEVCHKPKDGDREKHVIIIHTDGQENASRIWNTSRIKELISSREKRGNWTFTYFGANQDAWATARQYGFASGNTITYNTGDTRVMYAANARATSSVARSVGMNTNTFSAATAAAMAAPTMTDEQIDDIINGSVSTSAPPEKKKKARKNDSVTPSGASS